MSFDKKINMTLYLTQNLRVQLELWVYGIWFLNVIFKTKIHLLKKWVEIGFNSFLNYFIFIFKIKKNINCRFNF